MRMTASSSRMRTHRAAASALACALALACTIGSTGCDSVLNRIRPPGVIQPSIKPLASAEGSQTVARAFAFENSKVTLKVPVDRSVLAGAKSAQKNAIFVGGPAPGDWVPDYYRAFVGERHQDAFYGSILSALRSVRAKEGLDPSRYVELVTSMAQTLRYNTDPGALAPKFPIETFGDGFGDCDDKTLLAAALLSREGYDVSILLFQPEKHIALGIKAPGLDYKNTGYAYVEMTEPSLVGVPAEDLAGGVKLTSQPVVIKIGEGTKAYEAGAEIDYIGRRLQALTATQTKLKASITRLQKDLDAEQKQLNADRAALKTDTDPATLEIAIARYNAQVRAHNARVAELNRIVSRYNSLVEVERYVNSHRTARPQVFAKLRSARL